MGAALEFGEEGVAVPAELFARVLRGLRSRRPPSCLSPCGRTDRSARGVSRSIFCCAVSAENAAPKRERASASSAAIPPRKVWASCGLAASRRSICAGTPASAAPGVSVRGMIVSARAFRHSNSAAVRSTGCASAGVVAASAAMVTSTSRLVVFIWSAFADAASCLRGRSSCWRDLRRSVGPCPSRR